MSGNWDQLLIDKMVGHNRRMSELTSKCAGIRPECGASSSYALAVTSTTRIDSSSMPTAACRCKFARMFDAKVSASSIESNVIITTLSFVSRSNVQHPVMKPGATNTGHDHLLKLLPLLSLQRRVHTEHGKRGVCGLGHTNRVPGRHARRKKRSVFVR